MRRHILVLAVLLTALFAGGAHAQDISGAWVIHIERFGEPFFWRATLQVSDGNITGSIPVGATVKGTLRGEQVEIEVRSNSGNLWGNFAGKVRGAEMGGEGKFFGVDATWTARRPPVRPAGAPRVHDFTPQQFHRVFSGAIPPVLRIFPGDTVRTWSVSAGGRDAQGVRRSLGGNPLTGPFFIEGAVPGDMLVVRLNRVRLNSETAGSGSGIIGSALTPGYLRSMKPPEKFDSSWRLDRQQGVAMLAKPTERLKKLSIPLRPMLGCVGVAPPGRMAVPSGDSGPMGGNMDYNMIREGTTVYLPVNQLGALLFLGDGHAAQGDGELTGDALETSMEFEFTVDVQEGKSTGEPRAEDDEYLMAIGIAGSLDEAMRRSTSAMARWLESDYKLNSAEAAMVMGFAVRYDVADLVGAQVSIVAKIPKKILAQLN